MDMQLCSYTCAIALAAVADRFPPTNKQTSSHFESFVAWLEITEYVLCFSNPDNRGCFKQQIHHSLTGGRIRLCKADNKGSDAIQIKILCQISHQ